MNGTSTQDFLNDPHSLDVLEFDRIRDELLNLCLSDEGRAGILESDFVRESEVLATLHAKTRWLMRLFSLDLARPRYAFPAINRAIEHLKIEGSSLEAFSLKSIADYIRAASDLRRFAVHLPDDQRSSPLKSDAEAIVDLSTIEQKIRHYIDEDGNVREDLPELAAIASRLRNARSQLQQAAKRHLTGDRGMWQTDVPTMKDDRVVLPLKSDHRGGVQGIIRDVSPTGATVFIEPEDIVGHNNEISMLSHEYAAEIARILRRCTNEVRDHRDELVDQTGAVATVDALYARAQYGERVKGIAPKQLDGGVTFTGARHPMLGSSAVPIDVEPPEGTRVIIITGPNAGGKTVTLKTIGLFALMNQFGIPVPCTEGSAFALFDGVFADIGDEQSIDESLSTFSGHMRNISRFVREATSQSLVLLDELGSGTDPEEGSAIAMSVLDTLIERGTTVVVTSHHNVLKNYGYTRDTVVNASVSFDADSHRPTYRIIMGMPGESHAFEIAESSGLPKQVIDTARRYLDEQSTDVAAMIRQMTEKQRELDEQEKQFEERRSALNEKQRKTDLHSLRLRQRELELRTQGYRQLTKQMDEYRSQLENLVRELKSEGSVSKERTREVKEYIEQIEETARKEQQEIATEKHEMRPVTEIQPGMQVYIGKGKQRGEVVRAAKKGSWVVATDRMKITLPEHEIQGIAESDTKEPQITIQRDSSSPPPVFQLDVRGHRLNEAISEVESQIDRCILSGLTEFEVIHGLGEGILKRGVRDYLEHSGAVSGFEYADAEHGGFGKTIVKLA